MTNNEQLFTVIKRNSCKLLSIYILHHKYSRKLAVSPSGQILKINDRRETVNRDGKTSRVRKNVISYYQVIRYENDRYE